MASTSQATDSSTPDDEEGVREESFFKALADLKKQQFYWGNISAKTAMRLLKDQPPGTFLLRDSRSDHYFFSFTYQTDAGIFHTHVALHNGRYCLGGPNSMIQSTSLTKFVEKAMQSSKDKQHYNILMHPDPSKADQITAAVDIQFPFNRCALLPSLKHMCRIVVRHSLKSDFDIKKLPIPKSLQRYLASKHYLSPV